MAVERRAGGGVGRGPLLRRAAVFGAALAIAGCFVDALPECFDDSECDAGACNAGTCVGRGDAAPGGDTRLVSDTNVDVDMAREHDGPIADGPRADTGHVDDAGRGDVRDPAPDGPAPDAGDDGVDVGADGGDPDAANDDGRLPDAGEADVPEHDEGLDLDPPRDVWVADGPLPDVPPVPDAWIPPPGPDMGVIRGCDERGSLFDGFDDAALNPQSWSAQGGGWSVDADRGVVVARDGMGPQTLDALDCWTPPVSVSARFFADAANGEVSLIVGGYVVSVRGDLVEIPGDDVLMEDALGPGAAYRVALVIDDETTVSVFRDDLEPVVEEVQLAPAGDGPINIGFFLDGGAALDLDWISIVRPGGEQQEICDHLDNDGVDGVDEGFGVRDPCTVGSGACARDGVLTCGGPRDAVCRSDDPAPAGEPEVCNGEDDDCDGDVDEGVDVACADAYDGVCVRQGDGVCGPDGLDCSGAPGACGLPSFPALDGFEVGAAYVVDDGVACTNQRSSLYTAIDAGVTRYAVEMGVTLGTDLQPLIRMRFRPGDAATGHVLRYTDGEVELLHGEALLARSGPLGIDEARPFRMRLSYDGDALWGDVWQGDGPPLRPTLVALDVGPPGGSRFEAEIAERHGLREGESCIDSLTLGCPAERENLSDDDCDGRVDEASGLELAYEARLGLSDRGAADESSRARTGELVEVPLVAGGYADADTLVLPLDGVVDENNVRVLGGGLAEAASVEDDADGPFPGGAPAVRLRRDGRVRVDAPARAPHQERGLALFIWVRLVDADSSGVAIALRDTREVEGAVGARLEVTPGGGLLFVAEPDGDEARVVAPPPDGHVVDGWHHVGVTYDGIDERLCLYLDGRVLRCGRFARRVLVSSEVELVVGHSPDDAGSDPLEGSVCDAVWIQRTPTAAEVASWYAARRPYGAPLLAKAQPDFDDVRLYEDEAPTEFEIVGARPLATQAADLDVESAPTGRWTGPPFGSARAARRARRAR